MNKQLVVALSVAILCIVGLWTFFSYGGESTSPEKSSDSTQQQSDIMETEDKRLTKGNPKAPVKLVEYTDILCPYCAEFNQKTLPEIEKNYIDNDKVFYEVRLVSVGTSSPDSARAARGAYCAADQGKFWDYLDTAYKETWDTYYSKSKSADQVMSIKLFSKKDIPAFASKVGLDKVSWQQCMDDDKYTEIIEQNEKDMMESGGSGTPSFVANGQGISGAAPYDSFKALLNSKLKDATESKEKN